MQATNRALVTICIASVCWALSFGLSANLCSLWLQDAGASPTVIGLNTGVYYFGIALAALMVPTLMRRWGRGCLVVGMLASGVTAAWFPWGGNLVGWFVLRLLNGLAGAVSLIPMETLVNRLSTSEQRARNFGFYAFCIALGIALGDVLALHLYASTPRFAFLLAGVAGALAALSIFGWLRCPQIAEDNRNSRAPLEFRRHFLSFGSAWSQGYLEGGMVALLQVYLLKVGLANDTAGWLMGGIMMGVIIAQVPVAWLADRLGRTVTLLACYAVTAGALVMLYIGVNFTGLTLCLFLAGACSGAFYPLGLAVLGESVAPHGLARTSAWFLAINCLGSLIGPVVSGLAMDWLGDAAMFLAGLGAVLTVVIGWLVMRLVEFAPSGKKSQIIREPTTEERAAA
jgi:MFS family permease